MQLDYTKLLEILVGALLTSLPGLLALRELRRKNRAEAQDIENKGAGVILDSSLKLVNQYQTDQEKCATEVERLKLIIEDLKKDNELLKAQAAELLELRTKIADTENANGYLRKRVIELETRTVPIQTRKKPKTPPAT